jgi:hypothetical protein
LIEALQSVCDSPDAGSTLDIVVAPGDLDRAGSHAGAATHTAIICSGGIDLLGLRIRHTGDANDIQILGYWIPNSRTAAARG